MEQKPYDGVIKPYTLGDVHNYTLYNDLYARDDAQSLLALASDRTNNLSTIINNQVPYKRLAISSQEAKDAFLGWLQNRVMRQGDEALLKDAKSWALMRTWIAICAMVDAKDDPTRIKVLGKDGCSNELAKKAQDQGLLEILAANKERNK